MKSVKFLVESVASSGMVYKEGEIHTLEDHAAYHWMKRGTAESVEIKAEPKAKKPKDEKDDKESK